MFIAKYLNGDIITEKDMVWDDVKDGMHLLEITFPIPVQYQDPITGEIKPAPARTVALKGHFDRYYFYNEAIATLSSEGGSKTAGQGELVAKAIGGIDDKSGIVTEIKMIKGGFCEVRNYPVSELKIVRGIKQGAKEA